VQKKIDPKAHVNTLDPLLGKLRKRPTVTFLKRLTIVLDEESEKGFGLTIGNTSLVSPYDLIALLPTTATTFSQACLSHTTPSNLTAHIISLPLTLSRLPFNLKHTMVRTAIKNGAVFEIAYAGALGGDNDPAVGTAGGSEGGAGAKRNWWAAAREVVRVTKGKGVIVSSGVTNIADLRAPRDVGNLITMLDLAQNLAHDASTKTPQSLILRSQTRKTYRAVLSEPQLIIPEGMITAQPTELPVVPEQPTPQVVASQTEPTGNSTAPEEAQSSFGAAEAGTGNSGATQGNSRKRPRQEDATTNIGVSPQSQSPTRDNTVLKKKKKKN